MKKGTDKTSRLKSTFKVLHRLTWVFLFALFCALFVYSGNRIYRQLLTSSFFQTTHVEIHGNHTLSKTDILYYLGLNTRPNLLRLNLKSLYAKLTSHPWIRHASIQRRLPNTLLITIEERIPVAILKAGRFFYVDGDGCVFDTINKEVGCDFPILTGPRKPSEIRAYLPLIKEALTLISPRTNSLISEIHLDLYHGLTLITLTDSLPVKLGLQNLPSRLRRFQIIYHYLRRKEIIVKAIDCRYPDRIVVTYKNPPSAEDKREKTG